MKRAVDLKTWHVITSDELIGMHPDRYQEIRRAAAVARVNKEVRFACWECGAPVYAPCEKKTKLSFWRHNFGAPVSCPWWTGVPSSIDAINALQFAGRQETALHKEIKNTIGEILFNSSCVQHDSVVIDKYLIDAEGRRRPDVRAVYDKRETAFEIQLSTTQLPIIVKREEFYEKTAYRLLWLTWQFDPIPQYELRCAFQDIFYSHNKSIFSVDPETFNLSFETKELMLRAYWYINGAWETKIISLSNLNWLPNGLATVMKPWPQDFLVRWRKTVDYRDDSPTSNLTLLSLLGEVAQQARLQDVSGQSLLDIDFQYLLNCLLSIKDRSPIASKQKNVIELLNTFLYSNERQRFALIIERFIKATGNHDLNERNSVKIKLEKAKGRRQDGGTSDAVKAVVALFPELAVKEKARVVSIMGQPES